MIVYLVLGVPKDSLNWNDDYAAEAFCYGIFKSEQEALDFSISVEDCSPTIQEEEIKWLL